MSLRWLTMTLCLAAAAFTIAVIVSSVSREGDDGASSVPSDQTPPHDPGRQAAPNRADGPVFDPLRPLSERLAALGTWRSTAPTPVEAQALLAVLKAQHEPDTLRNEVGNLLRHHRTTGTVDALLAIVVDDSDGTRFRAFAVQHLGTWMHDHPTDRTRAVTDALVNLMGNASTPIAREAWWILAKQQHAQAFERARSVLDSGGPTSALDMAIRIARQQTWRDRLPAIRLAIDHEDAAIRTAALDAIGHLKDTAALPLVERRLGDADPTVAATAERVASTLKAAHR